MKGAAIDITDAEWEVMRVVWAQGPSTAKDIQGVLNDQMDWKAATTKTLIGRLKNKQALQCEAQGRAYIYRAAVDEGACIQARLDKIFADVCNRKKGQHVADFIQNHDWSQADIESLQAILARKKETAPSQLVCDCLPGQCRCQDCLG